MANVIKHKRGSGSDPVANDLVVGEVTIRTDVGKLFTKMDNGSVAEIAGGGSDIAINTLSSSSGTGGGSATFNGSAFRFTLSSPPSVSAQQLLVSINGVIQKPVAGTGQPSEGFSVDGTDIILGDAPETGADFFILTFKSLGVSEPADNSVTSAKIVDGAIVNADINASAAIAGSKIADFVTNNANNRVLTASGTANSLIGEDNLTFTGSILTVTNSSGPAELTLVTPNNTDSGVYFNDGSNSGAISYQHSDNSMRFRVNATEKMRIDSSGRVLVGTTTSDTGLLILDKNITAESDPSDTANYHFVIRSQSNSNTSKVGIAFKNTSDNTDVGAAILHHRTGGGSVGDLAFYTSPSAGTTTQRMLINSSGQVGIGTSSPTSSLHVSVGSSGTNSSAGFNEFCIEGGNEDIGMCFLSPAANNRTHTIAFGDSNNNAAGKIQYNHSTDDLTLTASDNIIFTGDAVGIGTTSPNTSLEIASTDAIIRLTDTNTTAGANDLIGELQFFSNDADAPHIGGFVKAIQDPSDTFGRRTALLFGTQNNDASTNAVEKVRIDCNGKVGIGNSSPQGELHVGKADNSNHEAMIILNNGGATGHEAGIEFRYESGTTPRAKIHVNSSDKILRFSTDNSERMRMDGSGHFLFNCTSIPSSSVAGMAFERNGNSGVLFHSNGSATTSINVGEFINGNGVVGRITTNGSNCSFTDASDYRLKENEVAISDGITRLKQLKPYRFNYKSDATKTFDGFFAHEAQTVVPESVVGEKDATKEDGSIDPQCIDQSKLVPLLVAALQEAIGRIEALEAG